MTGGRRAALSILVLAMIGSSPRLIGQEAGKPPADRLQFIACPIVRDSSTVPCWLAEYDGELYYLGSQGSSASAFYPPQLGHEALVEGTLAEGPRVCGGRPLSPVRVSVLQEINPACNTVLPAEPGLTPARSPIAPAPTFPDSTREFVISYDFDSDYLTLHTTRIVVEAARVAKASGAARVDVHGQRGATLLSNGRTVTEGPRIGEVRATRMAENLVGLGIPADRVHVTWQAEPDPPDGVTDPERRRVTIALRDGVADTACDRECLSGLAERYLRALVARDPAALPLAASAMLTENGTRVPIGQGLWQRRTTLRSRRDVFIDAAAGQVTVWAVLDESGSPLLLSARLRIADRHIQEIEAVIAGKGSHALFAPVEFAGLPSAYQQPLEPGQRSPRDRMIAIADGYFEGIARHDSGLVRSATDCNRFENGVRMTNRPGAAVTPRACAAAVDRLTHIGGVPERRYPLVDEERGVVLSMVVFDIPADGAATPPREGRMLLLAELFKIAAGEIQRIETVMHNLPYGARSGWAAP
jgi:outer membrane protein OmpA-like peptidoglycan-associated protein